MRNGLVEFLRARLDEEERAAKGWRRVREVYGRECPRCGHPVSGWGSPRFDWAAATLSHEDSSDCDVDAATWAAFGDGGPTPEATRSLREIEAKRMLVEEDHTRWRKSGRLGGAEWRMMVYALPYADHTDYRDDWKPEA